MIISLRKWLELFKYAAVFMFLSWFLYQALAYVDDMLLAPLQHYKEPVGQAVKAFQQAEAVQWEQSAKHRLLFFYWYGE